MLPAPGSDKPLSGSATAGDIPGDQELMLRMCKVLAQPPAAAWACVSQTGKCTAKVSQRKPAAPEMFCISQDGASALQASAHGTKM